MVKLILLLIFVIALIVGCEGKVKIFNTKTVDAVLFSPMEGKIFSEGKAAAGAVIRRKITLYGEDFLDDEFKVDDSGSFSLSKVSKQLELSPLNQFVVNHFKGEVFCSGYGIWIDYNKNPEGHRRLFEIMERIDGEHTIADIAHRLDISYQAVHAVVTLLVDKELVSLSRTAQPTDPRKSRRIAL